MVSVIELDKYLRNMEFGTMRRYMFLLINLYQHGENNELVETLKECLNNAKFYIKEHPAHKVRKDYGKQGTQEIPLKQGGNREESQGESEDPLGGE